MRVGLGVAALEAQGGHEVCVVPGASGGEGSFAREAKQTQPPPPPPPPRLEDADICFFLGGAWKPE